MRFAWIAPVIVSCLATAAPGQVKLQNSPRYEPGRKSVTTSQIKTRQVLTLAGRDLESKNSQYMELAEVPGPAAADGTRPVAYSFDALRITVSSPGIELKFDSADPDKPHAIPQLDRVLELFRRLAKSKWTATMGPDNLVQKIEYQGKPFADLDEDLRQEVDPEKDAQTANDILKRLPNRIVQPGEMWKRTERFNPGSGQMMEFDRELKYVGPKQVDGRTMHEIAVTTTAVRYLALGKQAPLKVTDSDLKVKTSNGTILYDPERGVMARSNETVHVVGDITFQLGENNTVAGKLDLTLESDTTFIAAKQAR